MELKTLKLKDLILGLNLRILKYTRPFLTSIFSDLLHQQDGQTKNNKKPS